MNGDQEKHVADMARAVLAAYRRWGDHNFRIFPKGKGVIVRDPRGVSKGHFINEYLGEVYPSWLFSERQNILDRLQTVCCGTHAKVLPDFWNMQLERHPEDPCGRQLFTIDPSHRANSVRGSLTHARPIVKQLVWLSLMMELLHLVQIATPRIVDTQSYYTQ
jgi:hypothetical protein